MDNENEQEKEQKKEKSLNQLLTSSLVDIYVGPESTHWPLHERLLCYHSPFFASIFYADDNSKGQKSYGLPETDEYPFELLVGWLYSRAIRAPQTEKDVGPLLDLYLLSEQLQMEKLSLEAVELIRDFYHSTSTYPGLRRVQYIYAETEEDNAMREMMVSSVARQLTTSEKIPAHWASALQRNGQLAVDIIRAIQQWNLEERSIPDARDGSRGRGRMTNGGFSAIEREQGDGSAQTNETTDTTNTRLGVESVNSGVEGPDRDESVKSIGTSDDNKSEEGKEPSYNSPYTKNRMSPSPRRKSVSQLPSLSPRKRIPVTNIKINGLSLTKLGLNDDPAAPPYSNTSQIEQTTPPATPPPTSAPILTSKEQQAIVSNKPTITSTTTTTGPVWLNKVTTTTTTPPTPQPAPDDTETPMTTAPTRKLQRLPSSSSASSSSKTSRKSIMSAANLERQALLAAWLAFLVYSVWSYV